MSLTFVPVTFIAGGLVLVWWALRRRQALALLPRDWLPVTGSVIVVGRARRVEYAGPDGRTRRLQVPPETPLPPNGEMDVLVDPRDPSRARLADNDRVAVRLVRLLLLLGVVSLVIGAVTAVVFG